MIAMGDAETRPESRCRSSTAGCVRSVFYGRGPIARDPHQSPDRDVPTRPGRVALRFRSSTRFAVQRSVSMSCRERTTMDRPSRSAAETMECADVSAYALPVMPFIATSTPKLSATKAELGVEPGELKRPDGRSQLGSCARSFAPSRAMPRMIARATSRAARRAGGGRAQATEPRRGTSASPVTPLMPDGAQRSRRARAAGHAFQRRHWRWAFVGPRRAQAKRGGLSTS